MLEINKTHWMLQSEELFKDEYAIPETPFDDMSPEEQKRTKAFYGKYCEPTALYMELANRIFQMTSRRENDGMAPYHLMHEAYMQDAGDKKQSHMALEALIKTYYWLKQPGPETEEYN